MANGNERRLCRLLAQRRSAYSHDFERKGLTGAFLSRIGPQAVQNNSHNLLFRHLCRYRQTGQRGGRGWSSRARLGRRAERAAAFRARAHRRVNEGSFLTSTFSVASWRAGRAALSRALREAGRVAGGVSQPSLVSHQGSFSDRCHCVWGERREKSAQPNTRLFSRGPVRGCAGTQVTRPAFFGARCQIVRCASRQAATLRCAEGLSRHKRRQCDECPRRTASSRARAARF